MEDNESQQQVYQRQPSSSMKMARERRLPSAKNQTSHGQRQSLKTFDLSTNLMKLNDLDFEQLLECAEEDIETTAFFASSVQLMGIIDGMTNAID